MTKKDYVLIANVFGKLLKEYHDVHTNKKWGFDLEDEYRFRGIEDAACNIADELAKDNPRFDRNKFLDVCKVVYRTDYVKIDELD